MAEPSSLRETIRRWERWTDSAHRYLLPIASAAGLGLAGAAVLGAPREVVAYAPWALAALGTGALATSLGYARWRSHLARLPPPTVRAPASRPRASARPRAEPDVEREWIDLVRRSWHTALAVPSGRTPRSSSAATAGDELWSHWQPLEVGTLPVELVGPVPETAWLPTAAGEPTPFPNKEPGFLVIGGELVPMPRAATAELASISSASPATGPAASPSAPRGGPASTLASSFVSAPAAPPPIETDLGWPALLGPLDELTSEALHPIPPHLRISPDSGATEPAPEPTFEPTREPAPEPESDFERYQSSPMCSSCSRVVPDETAWRPCPECGEPVCLPCRSEAVVFYGHTWCASCAIGRAWNHPMVVGTPERFSPALEIAGERMSSNGPGW